MVVNRSLSLEVGSNGMESGLSRTQTFSEVLSSRCPHASSGPLEAAGNEKKIWRLYRMVLNKRLIRAYYEVGLSNIPSSVATLSAGNTRVMRHRIKYLTKQPPEYGRPKWEQLILAFLSVSQGSVARPRGCRRLSEGSPAEGRSFLHLYYMRQEEHLY